MQEMNGLTVDLGRVLRELIQSGLMLAPVVAGTPVLGQVLEIVERNSSAPADARQLVGPASVGQAVVQVVQVGLGNSYFERLDTHVHFAPLLLCICDRFDHRRGRKKARISSTSSSGSSNAAKCPPRGIWVQCLTRKKRSPSSRGGTVRSLGNVATPAGTSIYCPALS